MIQLFASDGKTSIPAACALRSVDYRCLECNETVHIRGGPWRQPHFYHPTPNSHCRQSKKSMVHLQVQLALMTKLPSGCCQIEQRFPEIGRIADLVWFSEKLIFEIQCSPIKILEIQQRNRDYASLGYQVVWILHDRRYNRFRVSAAEETLSTHPHYFTNINQEGLGMIYDQFSVIEKGLRLHKLPPLFVDPSYPIALSPQTPICQALHRRKQWPLHFQGDLLDCPESYFEAIKALERKQPEAAHGTSIWKKLAHAYHSLLQLMLELVSS